MSDIYRLIQRIQFLVPDDADKLIPASKTLRHNVLPITSLLKRIRQKKIFISTMELLALVSEHLQPYLKTHPTKTLEEGTGQLLAIHVITLAIRSMLDEESADKLRTETIINSTPRIYASKIEKPTIDDSPRNNRFKRQGDYWEILYKGRQILIRHQKGLSYIRHLLLNPGREIDVLELVRAVEPKSSEEAIERNLPYEVLDITAISAYRLRLKEIIEERSKAEQENDLATLERLNEESETIHNQLSKAIRLGGRIRTFANDTERARSKIRKQIQRAREKISESNKELGSFLTDTIKTGKKCSYNPNQNTFWES